MVDDADGNRASTVLYQPGTTAAMRFAGRQQPAAPCAPDGPPDRVHMVGAGRRDAGHASGDVPVHVRRARHRRAAPRRVRRVHRGVFRHAPGCRVRRELYIGAPVGSGVPSGSYNRAEAEWEPEHGRVVEVVSETAGRADSTPTATATATAPTTSAALKITDGERPRSRRSTSPGQSLGGSRSTTSASGTSTGVVGSGPGPAPAARP